MKCWGENKKGQLGNGTKRTSLTPQIAKGMGSHVTAVSVSDSLYSNNICAIQRQAVKCAGDNLYNQLGNDRFRRKYYSSNFIPVKNLESNVESLISFNRYNCANQKGILKCWGNNENGQLGNGKKEGRKEIKAYIFKIVRNIKLYYTSFMASDLL